MVSQVADSLVKNGKVVRGYLGVNLQTITPALKDSFNLKSNKGALVGEVVADSPAAKAGLKEGDVITALNGQAVDDSKQVQLQVIALPPGSKVALDVLRDGKSKQLTVTTGERPGARGSRQLDDGAKGGSSDDEGVLNGVAVDDLNRNTRQQFNLPGDLKGAVVTQVDPNSAAAKAGLRPGDVILEINKQRVENAQAAVDLSAKAESKKTLLRVWTRGSKVFVVVDETNADKSPASQ
jgi:serine protease Do